ncbi:MAG: glutathione S-transferase family protein, partial [Chlamydiia bacterium]|nr:glutathione S-transferase family protein [Chlamydiia bacterium]
MSTFPDTLQDLFRPQPDALTLYTNKRSPCARRVRIALEEKGIPYHLVEVDLDNRYNHSPAYLEINPQGKVPAIALRRFRGLEDVSLYESNALTEWADEQFTDDGPQLYPSNRLERFQAKQWQEWESRMAEDFWRVIYANSRGFMMRLRHNETSYRELLDTRYPERPDLRQKLWKTYDGSLLSRSETVRRIKNIYRAFDRIEQHLSTCPVAEDGKRYLVGGRFTIADVSVLPRIAIAPFAGMLSSRWEKSEYPLLTQYVRDLGERPSFAA